VGLAGGAEVMNPHVLLELRKYEKKDTTQQTQTWNKFHPKPNRNKKKKRSLYCLSVKWHSFLRIFCFLFSSVAAIGKNTYDLTQRGSAEQLNTGRS
jgi:hypothetical protein